MKQKSIKKNMLMSIILTASNFIFPLITFSYVSRILTPTGTGKVAFVSSIIQYFSYIATLGIPAYGLREAAKVRDNKDKLSKLVHELFIINIISTILSFILLFIAVLCIPKLYDYKILILIMSISIGLNTIGLEWLYNALEEYSYITIRSLLFKIIYIPLVFLLIHSKSDYLIYGFLTIFVTSANYICNFINIRKHIYFKKYDEYNLKKHIKPILVLFSASIIISIYNNFDVIMIGFMKSEFSVGLYNTALKIKNIILSLSTAITAVLIPRIANYIGRKNEKVIKELILKSFKTSMLLSLPFAIYILIFPKQIILLISGSKYISASPTLQVLMVCIILLILTNLFGNQLLIPLGKEKRFSQSVFVGLFINLFLNLLLIPTYGLFGAAIGTLVTEFWNVIWMSTGVGGYAKYLLKNAKIYIYAISIIIAGLLSFLVYNYVLDIRNIFIVIVTSIVFFGTYYLQLLLLKEELIHDFLITIKKKVIR